jgi:dihydrofolate synthase/folylpolyglutamate synthase
MPHTLADWLSHLESLHPKTIALGLDRVAQVKLRLNLSPDFPVIVVGGTNGKGSVCAMLEAILQAAGYRVGCYTSPHLLRYNERVRIAGQQADDAELCASFAAIECARGDIELTYFEFGTLAAMQCFVSHGVEVAVLEVGLGGRLDAVNVFDADCAVVTSVDIDHVDYLGDNREAIGYEKAGIFRPGRVAVCGERDAPASLVRHARDIGAELWRIGVDFGFTAEPQQWRYQGPVRARDALPHPALRGGYQLGNASCVLAVLDALHERLPVGMQAVRQGLLAARVAGRFQCIPGKPELILDVAHNPHAARALASNLAAMPPARVWAVCAMLGDKDMAGVVEALAGRVSVWLVAGLPGPRGNDGSELAALLRERGAEVHRFENVTDAISHASNAADGNDRIAVFGSFFTVAEALQARGLSVG